MTVAHTGFSLETLTLPHEDSAEHRRLHDEWMTAYPCRGPIERGFLQQAVVARIEKRRVERIRATMRTQKVRTAVLFFDRKQEDDVAKCVEHFNVHSCSAIANWEELATLLAEDGTWYGSHRFRAIQLQGLSANITELFLSEEAYRTWLDCLVAQPNPKPDDVEVILERTIVPKGLLDRDVRSGRVTRWRAGRGSRPWWTASCRGCGPSRKVSASSTRTLRGPKPRTWRWQKSRGRRCRCSAPSGCTSSRTPRRWPHC
jgi:hypothetical protein